MLILPVISTVLSAVVLLLCVMACFSMKDKSDNVKSVFTILILSSVVSIITIWLLYAVK